MYREVRVKPEDIQFLSQLKATYQAIGSDDRFDALTRITKVVAYHYGAQCATDQIEKDLAEK